MSDNPNSDTGAQPDPNVPILTDESGAQPGDPRDALRARLASIRTQLAHGENGDLRALADAVRSLVNLLDEGLGAQP